MKIKQGSIVLILLAYLEALICQKITYTMKSINLKRIIECNIKNKYFQNLC